MFFAFFRLFLILLVIGGAAYVVISIWSRRTRRAKLEAEWDQEGMEGDREAWIEAGLDAYDESIRRKLILGVFVVPFGVIAAIIYLTNDH